MQFQDPLYPTEACTCCRAVGKQLSRTYQRCRACYAGCPALGSHVADPVPALADDVRAGRISGDAAIRSLL